MSSDRHRTLFAIPAADRRARQQLAGARPRNKGKHKRSSDVTRFFAVAVAAVAAVVGMLAAWLAAPPTSSGPSGALALPHQSAGLSCESCHQQDNAPAKRCVSCHGAHPSTRGPHRRLAKQGELRCIDCHDVHGSDQGIRWQPGEQGVTTLRYWVGRHTELSGTPLETEQPITVPLIPLSRCQRCHALDNQRDPLWRCVMASPSSRGAESSGNNQSNNNKANTNKANTNKANDNNTTNTRSANDNSPNNNNTDAKATKSPTSKANTSTLNGCFDEHRSATDISPRPGKVCSAQHGGQRFAAWDAARTAVLESPQAAATPPRNNTPLWWLAGGLLGAAIGATGASLWQRLRRRPQSQTPQQQLKPAERVRLPQINTNTCLGCYACVDACPYDVLEIERYVARLARPEACCGLTLCEQVCPNGSLIITDGDPIGDRPNLDDELQAIDAPGVYLAGDITGLPLIKNAILQGRQALDALADALPDHNQPLDVLIVGAGPAGISAALRAKERGLRFQVIEQGSVAQSIRSFPRGKLVFAQPLELPVAGKLWLEESTKEELLSKWLRIVRQEKLDIREGTRFISLQQQDGALIAEVRATDKSAARGSTDKSAARGSTDKSAARGGTTTAHSASTSSHDGETIRAARVLLCVGQRGTPRKLDIALDAAAENKVHYHLADARSFVGKRVLVVGLGDVAMETAVALARQPDTRVTVSYRGEDFSRGKARNVRELKRLIDGDRIEMIWRSTVEHVGPESVRLSTPHDSRTLDNDAVFVMIGSLPPKALLERAGVRLR